mgnify:FL=1
MSKQSPNSALRQFLWLGGIAFIVPLVYIFLLTTFVAGGAIGSVSEEAATDAAVAERLSPVGSFKLAAVATNKAPRTGEEMYKSACTACHENGTAGAPKKGDTAAWAPRIAQGFDTLLKNALNGKNAMPAKGGVTDASEYEVARAVVYLTSFAGGKFKEPAAPAAAAAPAK